MARKPSKHSGTEALLVELLTEELPPNALVQLAEAFGKGLLEALSAKGFAGSQSDLSVFATPRRLAALITKVVERTPDRPHVIRGPSVAQGLDSAGKPTQALTGWMKKNGLQLDRLDRENDPKGERFIFHAVIKGTRLRDTLEQEVSEVVRRLPIRKTMRWGNGDAQFVRPVHGLVMMHGKQVVPGAVLGVRAGNTTRGHRFMGTPVIRLANANEYAARLEKAGQVIADFGDRKSEIEKQLKAEAKRHRASLGEYRDLLEEVTALVELPAIYLGTFDPSFLEIPQECLILTMRKNQKYFPLFGEDGKLLAKFLIVSNLRVADPRHIVRGNERVVQPRLEDARFFFNQDRRIRLEARIPQLSEVVYHNRLGTQLERTHRVKRLAGQIAQWLDADVARAERAAELSKADLSTGMVGEFPELQGTMGRYYALHDGEPSEVADAIEAHYRPRFAGDALPLGPIACVLALADKLDTLAGLFSVGLQPTGDKDPFGLRRAALGVVRIVVETQLALSLHDLINEAFRPFAGKAQTDLQVFFSERMRSYFHEQGASTNEVEAVLSLNPVAISSIPKQLQAVRAFSALPEAASLAAANKRIGNILRQAESKGESFSAAEAAVLKEPAERALFHALQAASRSAGPLFEAGDFTGYLRTFASLKNPVDDFFDTVMVMADDTELRKNRLALLTDMRKAMNRFADISKLAA